MRVLILSCNTGEGHNSCAKAIKEIYDSHGEVCDIYDSLKFISKDFSNFISWGHTTVYRHLPWLFKFAYVFFEKHPSSFNCSAPIYKLLTCGAKKLYNFIEEGKYDAVICVHPFSALLLTKVKSNYNLKAKTGFVATDYTCSPSVKQTNLDLYFIPHDSLCYDFECENIPKQKIIGSGIPIRQMFYKNINKDEAKKQFGINPRHKHLLIMCGSMGCGPIKNIAKILEQGLNSDCEVSIVCGTNKKLEKKLKKEYTSNKNFHILGFVANMSELMDSADLYLGKPGGISVTEAYVKNLPTVYIDAVAGCEEYNRSYFVRLGVAKTACDTKGLAMICIDLIKDDKKRAEMLQTLSLISKKNAAESIYTSINKCD